MEFRNMGHSFGGLWHVSKNKHLMFVTRDYTFGNCQIGIHYYHKPQEKWTHIFIHTYNKKSGHCILDSTKRYIIMFSRNSLTISICDLTSIDKPDFKETSIKSIFAVRSICSVRSKPREEKVSFGYVRIATQKLEMPDLPFAVMKTILAQYLCLETIAIVGHEENEYALINIECILRTICSDQY